MKRKTTVEFINEAKNVHFDKDYDYSFVDYINNETKVDIYCNVCKKHFFQRPNDHLCGRGCPSCNILSTEIFINRSNYIHNYYYDYSLTIYKNNKTKVKIICPKHGIFEPRADDHMNGHICKKCSDEKFIKTTDYFICKAIEKHGIFYIYSKTKYINAKENVIITCPKHGDFLQQPNNHLSGCGCKICNVSFMERQIIIYLEKNNIRYISQKTFDDCRGIKNKLPFDFYLIDYNICIEYDGEQHEKPIKWFGGDDTLIKIKRNDKLKNEYCFKNDILLIRINYDENLLEKMNYISKFILK